ncbi:MAG: tetratricopeptide repeat protein, partial [bacterium]
MLNLRRCLVGVVAVLVVGAAGCSSETPEVAALRVDANAGDAGAQNNLGVLYRNGTAEGVEGVSQDWVEAVSWFRKAAEQGLAEAQSNLGAMYQTCRGVPCGSELGATTNGVEMMSWYRQAAEQGHVIAQYNLGNAYAAGRGAPQDYVEAASWYRKAADQGHEDAQAALEGLYDDGRVPQSAGRLRIAVAPLRSNRSSFDLGGRSVPADDVLVSIERQLIDVLAQTERFAVLDRDFGAEIEWELSLDVDGQTSNLDFERLGEALSADQIWVGTVNDFNYTRSARQLRTSSRELVSF